ncbi:hypothetical protein MNQ98_20110 [Paenibacillus sp. N3/727]|uniref:hypothetical protein n=1 Tax=Paenibacillus sp. N3/727 TaxID=2925845 RepID=UPI001F537C1D|nr:hypothetical protein [Paenibacillus sp. N3/727]UNK16789.1 hypothetical protein MNQ98_20110 [Paenibacillus sp. N3/727]
MISYVIVIALALIGGVATVMVGLSQENKKSSPKYERRTKTNMVRLVLLYVLALAAFVTIWVIYN